MTKRLAWIVLLVFIGLGLWWLLHRGSYDFTNFPPTANGPWVAFGDSLTAGYGASEAQDYPTLLGQRLGIPIKNLGQSGATSADGLERLPELERLNPRVVLLCLGGNDGLQRMPQADMFANIGRIIDALHSRGTFVVLIGVRSASLRDQNASGFRRLARAKGVFHVPDILRGIFPKPIYMLDAIHPNDAGYDMISARLAEELEPLLPKLQATGGASPTE